MDARRNLEWQVTCFPADYYPAGMCCCCDLWLDVFNRLFVSLLILN